MSWSKSVEWWAQQGIDSLCDPYRSVSVEIMIAPDGRLDEPRSLPVRRIDLVEASAMIRCAYAKGYSAALTEAEPIEDAAERATTLGLMLPS